MKFAVLIGWNGSVIQSFLHAGEETGNEIKIKYPRLDPVDKEFIDFVRDADAVFIHHFSGENIYSNILEDIESVIKGKKNVIAIDPILSNYSTVSKFVEEKVSNYYFYGGYENIKNMVLFIENTITPRHYEEPVEMPFSGIYEYGNTEFPKKVGILFYRTAWVDRDTKIIQYIIDNLNNNKISAIPVFTNGFGDRSRGIMSAEECINTYFYSDGKPVVDAVINLLSFSLIKKEDKSTLMNLGVPVFQGLIYYYKEEKEWLDSSGLDVVSTIMSAMLPEMDGTIEPVLIGVIKKIYDRGTIYRELVPVKEQAQYMINRIRKWVNLRYMKNSEKKIAIILHSGSSFKDLEANIGTATGLDTLNSVSSIMSLLRENGYNMDYLPENGESLIKTIMEKKAIPEGKWTPVEEIINKGGSVYGMPVKEYMKFFRELPEDSQDMIIKRWGELNTERDYMLLNGTMHIPGIISGNIFIGIQPKRITFADNEIYIIIFIQFRYLFYCQIY